LIDNAVKYTEKGKIELILGLNTSGNIMVELKDTGIGMSKEFLPSMFNPFTQEEQGFTRSYEGNGLGLMLVKKYCELNNMNIEIVSEKNVGSTFRIIFDNMGVKEPKVKQMLRPVENGTLKNWKENYLIY